MFYLGPGDVLKKRNLKVMRISEMANYVFSPKKYSKEMNHCVAVMILANLSSKGLI